MERSHRIDSEEFYRLLEGQVIDDPNLFSEKLQEREDYYNYHRPHGALDGQTPYERIRQKPKTRWGQDLTCDLWVMSDISGCFLPLRRTRF